MATELYRQLESIGLLREGKPLTHSQARIITQIEQFNQQAGFDALQPIGHEKVSITGSTPAVSTMNLYDHGFGMARSLYELDQAHLDFGYLQKEDPLWQRPGFFVYSAGQRRRYDGTPGLFAGAQVIESVNHGILPIINLSIMAPDESLFRAHSTDDRNGGYGQGMKATFAHYVSSLQQRYDSLRAEMEDRQSGQSKKGRLTSQQLQHLDHRLAEMQAYLQQYGDHQATVVIEAQDIDGSRYRAYGYGESLRFAGKDTWQLHYLICKMDEAAVEPHNKGMVVIGLHNPDPTLAETLEAAPNNMLMLNPHYPHPLNEVRAHDTDGQDIDTRPVADVKTYQSDHTPFYRYATGGGTWTGERIRHPLIAPGFYYRHVRMLTKQDMIVADAYNVSEHSETTGRYLYRTASSVYVEGPATDIVRAMVSTAQTATEYANIFNNIRQLPDFKHDTLSAHPEAFPISSDTADIQPEQQIAAREGYLQVWPDSNGFYTTDPMLIKNYKDLTGKTIDVPVLTEKLTGYLNALGIVDLKTELDQIYSKEFYISDIQNAQIVRIPDADLLADEGNSLVGVDKIYQILESDNLFGFVNSGFSYEMYPQFNSVKFYNHDDNAKIYYDNDQILHSSRIQQYYRVLLELHKQKIDSEIVMADLMSEDFEIRLEIRKPKSSQTPYFTVERKRKFTGAHYYPVLIIRPDVGQLPNYLPEIEKRLDTLNSKWAANRPNIYLNEQERGEREREQLRFYEGEVTRLKAAATRQSDRAILADRLQISNFNAVVQNLGVRMTGNGDGEPAREVFYAYGRGGINLEGPLSYRAMRNRAKEMGQSAEIRFSQPHFMVQFYTGNRPLLYPIVAQNVFHATPDGIRMSCSAMSMEMKNQGPTGQKIWRVYDPKKDGALSQRDYAYDGIHEIKTELRASEDIAYLPISALQQEFYEVLAITIPVTAEEKRLTGKGKGIKSPDLIYDPVNNQYFIQFNREDKEALQALPSGTRIYLKHRHKPLENDELYLRMVHPDYYATLTEHDVAIENLNPTLQGFFSLINKNSNMNRKQRMAAAQHYLERVHQYTDNAVFQDNTELLNNPIGVCSHEAARLALMGRLMGVPTRVRVAYVDPRNTGILVPPTHLIVEFLTNGGIWQRQDPPNSRIHPDFGAELARQALDGEIPQLVEASILAHEPVFSDERLPAYLVEYLEAIPEANGYAMSDRAYQQADEIIHARGAINRDTILRTMVAELVNAIAIGSTPRAPEIEQSAEFIMSPQVVATLGTSTAEALVNVRKLVAKYGADPEQALALVQTYAQRHSTDLTTIMMALLKL